MIPMCSLFTRVKAKHTIDQRNSCTIMEIGQRQPKVEESHMRKRDLAILLLSCLAIAISFKQDNFSFQESWVQLFDGSFYANGHYPTEDYEKLPNPLITDVDGDDLNEIIFVTSEYKIKIVQMTESHVGQFTELPVRAEATLLPSVKVSTGRKPILLQSGYLTPFNDTTEKRQQVIVVITDGWTVLCFNHNLKLLWETQVKDFVPPDSHHLEVAAIVTSQSIRVGDRGVVIVGGRLSQKKEEENNHEHWDSRAGQIKQEELNANMVNEELDDLDEEEHDTRHFSYYALDGRTGGLRWSHEEGDFYSLDTHEGEEEQRLMPEHSYKLHVFSNVKHLGEMDWRQFRHSIVDQLPHVWRRREDTNFVLDHFEKKRVTGDINENDKWSSEDIGIPKSHIPGLIFGGHAPHAPSEHVVKPNVFVAHLGNSLEAIHLYTGRTVCRLITKPVGAYADLNGDGIIEHVNVVAQADGESAKHQCFAIASAGIPVVDRIFNVSLCKSRGGLGSLFADVDLIKSADRTITAATPLVLNSRHSETLMSLHHENELDTIFLLSNGRMSSYRPNGKMNWQIDTDATWGGKVEYPWYVYQGPGYTFSSKMGLKYDGEVPSSALAPSLQEFEVEPFSNEKYILAVTTSIVLVSPTGYQLASTMVADTVISTPVIGDFNNDGLNDVIITTPLGYFGYTLKQSRAGAGLFSILTLLLVLTMVGLFAYGSFAKKQQKKVFGKRALD